MKTKAYTSDGSPRYVRCYDNGGETLDRYTVVFTRVGHKAGMRGRCFYLGMSENPFRGVGQHGEHDRPIDRPGYAHLGKKVPFTALTPEARVCTMRTYAELWGKP